MGSLLLGPLERSNPSNYSKEDIEVYFRVYLSETMSTRLIVAVLAVFCLFAISMGSEGPWKRDGEDSCSTDIDCAESEICYDKPFDGLPSFCATGGWFVANEDTNCIDTCTDQDLVCSESQLHEHNVDVDESMELWTLIKDLGESPPGSFSCSSIVEAAAPLFIPDDKCFYSDPSSESSTFDCGAIPNPTGENKQRLCWCHLPPPLPPRTFGVCSSPIWNRWRCGKGMGNWKYSRLQRFDHPHQGDVCYHNNWPKNKTWRCPKNCYKVSRPPFCKNKDGDACHVPLPGGGSPE